MKQSQNTYPSQSAIKNGNVMAMESGQNVGVCLLSSLPVLRSKGIKHLLSFFTLKVAQSSENIQKSIIQSVVVNSSLYLPKKGSCKMIFQDCKVIFQDCKAIYQAGKMIFQDCKVIYQDCKAVYQDCKAAYQDCKITYQACLKTFQIGKVMYQACKTTHQACKTVYHDLQKAVGGCRLLFQGNKFSATHHLAYIDNRYSSLK